MIKRIICAILSLLTPILQILKIYDKEDYIYSLDTGMTVNNVEYNFFSAIASNSFSVFEKVLMLLFFIVPILVGIYFIQSIWTKFSSTNLDLIFIIIALFTGLFVFSLTTVIGHVISCFGMAVLIVYIIFQIKED